MKASDFEESNKKNPKKKEVSLSLFWHLANRDDFGYPNWPNTGKV